MIKLFDIRWALSASQLRPLRSRDKKSFARTRVVVIATVGIEVATFNDKIRLNCKLTDGELYT